MTRKVFLILLALVLALSVGLVGCAASPTEQEEEEPGEQEEEEDGGEVAGAFCIGFDDLTLSAQYEPFDNFSSGGLTMKVMTYVDGNGKECRPPPCTPDPLLPPCCGHVQVCNYSSSFCDFCQPKGSGQYLLLYGGVNLLFSFQHSRESVSLVFGESGGQVNLMINDIDERERDLQDFDGAIIGGVLVTVVVDAQGVGNLTLSEDSAKIDRFHIGGEEFCIDDVCVE